MLAIQFFFCFMYFSLTECLHLQNEMRSNEKNFFPLSSFILWKVRKCVMPVLLHYLCTSWNSWMYQLQKHIDLSKMYWQSESVMIPYGRQKKSWTVQYFLESVLPLRVIFWVWILVLWLWFNIGGLIHKWCSIIGVQPSRDRAIKILIVWPISYLSSIEMYGWINDCYGPQCIGPKSASSNEDNFRSSNLWKGNIRGGSWFEFVIQLFLFCWMVY